MIGKLALTNDGKLVDFNKEYVNYLAIQRKDEEKNTFLKRVAAIKQFYKYVCKDEDIYDLKQDLINLIPEKYIEEVENECHGESWIIAYGYKDKAYQNNGSWGKTEPYPYLTSDGKSFIDMYMLNITDIESINESNFITPFNKNKDIDVVKEMKNNDLFILDKNKRLYKAIYPNISDYKNVYIKHITSYERK